MRSFDSPATVPSGEVFEVGRSHELAYTVELVKLPKDADSFEKLTAFTKSLSSTQNEQPENFSCRVRFKEKPGSEDEEYADRWDLNPFGDNYSFLFNMFCEIGFLRHVAYQFNLMDWKTLKKVTRRQRVGDLGWSTKPVSLLLERPSLRHASPEVITNFISPLPGIRLTYSHLLAMGVVGYELASEERIRRMDQCSLRLVPLVTLCGSCGGWPDSVSLVWYTTFTEEIQTSETMCGEVARRSATLRHHAVARHGTLLRRRNCEITMKTKWFDATSGGA